MDPVTNNLAVTGGEDDKAYLWNVNDGQVVFECTGVIHIHIHFASTLIAFLYTVFLIYSFGHVFFLGHKDSVTCATFSHDSKLVVTGDMSGLIKVWKIDTKEEIWSFEVGDLEVCKLKSVFKKGKVLTFDAIIQILFSSQS